MKKLIAMILCVLLVVSMSVTAFAADVADGDITSNTDSKKTGSVDVQVFDKSTGEPIETTGTYKVTITWGNLLFKIEVANANDVSWNGSAYTITNGKWDHEEANVTVKNLSDMPVDVNGLFDNGAETSATVDGVTAEISGGLQHLTSAVGLTEAEAPVATYVVKITETVPTTLTKLEFTVDVIELTIQTAA